MVTRLKNIAPVQLAIVMGVMYALIGVIIALLMSPFMALMATLGGGAHNSAPFAGMGMVGALILFPIMYGILGFIGGALSAFVYNIVAGWTGGVQLTLESPVQVDPVGTVVAARATTP